MSSSKQVELLQGTLDMLILRTLQWGPQHGHGIGQAIRHSSADLLKIERGSLYPALHRLEEQGLIASEWKASEMNRRAKYYRLMTAGSGLAFAGSRRMRRMAVVLRLILVSPVTVAPLVRVAASDTFAVVEG
jgi:PadR family transcriptional regulator, regulatory protein PadR